VPVQTYSLLVLVGLRIGGQQFVIVVEVKGASSVITYMAKSLKMKNSCYQHWLIP